MNSSRVRRTNLDSLASPFFVVPRHLPALTVIFKVQRPCSARIERLDLVRSVRIRPTRQARASLAARDRRRLGKTPPIMPLEAGCSGLIPPILLEEDCLDRTTPTTRRREDQGYLARPPTSNRRDSVGLAPLATLPMYLEAAVQTLTLEVACLVPSQPAPLVAEDCLALQPLVRPVVRLDHPHLAAAALVPVLEVIKEQPLFHSHHLKRRTLQRLHRSQTQ